MKKKKNYKCQSGCDETSIRENVFSVPVYIVFSFSPCHDATNTKLRD